MSNGRRIEDMLGYSLPDGGFFLEIGCWDGSIISQTEYLEREKGWTGVCVDPFPRNFEGRTCKLVRAAVSMDGKPREFVKVTIDRRNSGDVSYFSGFRDAIGQHWPMISEFCDYEILMVDTITFKDLAASCVLPSHIDYMIVDTEGSEAEVFARIDFDAFTFGVIMFEHNGNEFARDTIGRLLRGRGYKLEKQLIIDDIYVGG